MCVCKRKTPDWNDWKLGTIVVLDSPWKYIYFGFERSRLRGIGSSFLICGMYAATKFKFCAQMHYRQFLPVDKNLCLNTVSVTEHNFL